MANIPLQSITFPDLLNIYNVPTMEGIGKSIFPELIAGGLVDLDSYVEDSVPYLFAAMPQGAGKVLADELVGAKVAWNQFINQTSATTRTFNAEATYYGSIGDVQNANFTLLTNHVYVFGAKVSRNISTNNGCAIMLGDGASTVNIKFENGEADGFKIGIGKRASDYVGKSVSYNNYGWKRGMDAGDSITVENAMAIDLTQMLGSTIADHIYSLEQGTAGAGVAFFTKYFGNGYRPYDAGSLQGALVSGHKTIGTNQWDEEWANRGYNTSTGEPYNDNSLVGCKNYIPIMPNTSYCIGKSLLGGANTVGIFVLYYDSDKNFLVGQNATVYTNWGDANFVKTTPSNAHYMRFFLTATYGTTYKNDICINISNADINGKYFPYEEHTYDIEPEDLNGMFKLVDGELKADGDIRHADGTADRRYGLVDLGSLNWSISDNIFYASPTNMLAPSSTTLRNIGIISNKYSVDTQTVIASASMTDKTMLRANGSIWIRDTSYSSTSDFKTAMSGVYLVYELATPTEDTADPFEEYQHCNPYGTQEYLFDDSQTVPIPAGHNTKYFEDPLANIMARLDALENA